FHEEPPTCIHARLNANQEVQSRPACAEDRVFIHHGPADLTAVQIESLDRSEHGPGRPEQRGWNVSNVIQLHTQDTIHIADPGRGVDRSTLTQAGLHAKENWNVKAMIPPTCFIPADTHNLRVGLAAVDASRVTHVHAQEGPANVPLVQKRKVQTK